MEEAQVSEAQPAAVPRGSISWSDRSRHWPAMDSVKHGSQLPTAYAARSLTSQHGTRCKDTWIWGARSLGRKQGTSHSFNQSDNSLDLQSGISGSQNGAEVNLQ